MSRHLPPLSPTLNRAVLALAAKHWPHGWETTDEDTQAVVERQMTERCPTRKVYGCLPECWSPAGRFPVYAGASERTIFGDPAVNHAFRAWHDAWHLRLRAPFTPEGEERVYREQHVELVQWWSGDTSNENQKLLRDALALLRAEILGQLEHQSAHGAFPVNQRAFVRAYVRNPERARARKW